jgi:DNA-binding transcriptional LysR family regulator
LEGVPVFLAAARTASATAAAARLGVAPATVLRQLAALEEHLGVVLFDRTPSGLLRTAAAEIALPWAEQIEAAGHALRNELHGLEQRAAGVVRFALLPAVSNAFVAPAVPRLHALHPDIVLELLPASAVLDLTRREADLALRLVRPEHGDLVVRKLADTPAVLVAAPSLLARVAARQLSDLPWLDWEASVAAPEARLLAAVVPGARVVLRSTEMETLLQAARAGVGALVCGEPVAARTGGLVRVPLATPPLPAAPLWLVAHRALRDVPRVAAVWRWILETFEQEAAEGRLSLPVR